MRTAHFVGAAALGAAIFLAPSTGSAQQSIEALDLTVTTTPAVLSDYLFRGISQTRGRPAAQATLDIEHGSGIYVGAFISNVAFPGTNLRQELDLAGGYRFEVGGVKLDIGATYFTYPGYDAGPGGFEWAWWEVNLRANYEVGPVKLLGQVSYAPNFNFESGEAWYVEAGVDIALPMEFTLSGRVGHQWIQYNTTSPSNHGSFGTPDYTVFAVGLSRELFAGVIGSVTFSTTTIDRQDCFGGQSFCGTRVVAGVSRPF